MESRLVLTDGQGNYYRRRCWANDLERLSEWEIRDMEQVAEEGGEGSRMGLA